MVNGLFYLAPPPPGRETAERPPQRDPSAAVSLQKASPLLTSITIKVLKSRVGETRHSLKILTVSDK